MRQIKRVFVNNKERAAQYLFWTAFMIEALVMMFSHSAFELPYTGRILHVAFVLFGVKIVLTRYTRQEWIIIVLLGIVGVLSYFSMGEEWFIRIVMLIIASKNVSMHKAVKDLFYIATVGTIIIIVLSLLGYGGQIVDVRDYGRGSIEARWCLGFSHANNLHGTLWYVVSLGILTYINKLKWYHGVCLTILNYFLYTLTLSRTGFLVTEMVILAALLYVYYPRISEWKWIYAAGGVGTALCAFIGIFVVIFGIFSLPGLKGLSDMLTVRLECLTWWESTEMWSLFGDGRERRPTDVGFITLISEYGYVIFAIYLLCLFLMIYYYCRNKKWMEFIVLMTCVLYTFMESTYVFNVYLLGNFTFILLLGTWNRLLKKQAS